MKYRKTCDTIMHLLSSTINTAQLTDLISNSRKQEIAEFIFQRFSERYFDPIERLEAHAKHGFSIMAISCLVIESFESYKSGWQNTRSKSELAFRQFFERESRFELIKPFSSDFYRNIRCGILHQSETTNGWSVIRKGKLFDREKKSINATEFLQLLKETIKEYCESLKESDWDSEDWDNLRRKLRQIIKNCKT